MAKRLGERLVEAGLVSAEAVEQALGHQKITRHRLGDCLVDLGLLPEHALLRFLAQELKTRFVSADKLAKARIGPEVLDKVPVRMAEAGDFLPLAYDADRKLLSVVMAEPQHEALVKELASLTGASEVFAYVGVRSAIQAAIKRHYYGDPTAFAALEKGGVQALRSDVSKVAQAYEAQAASFFHEQRGSGSSSGRSSQSQLREALGAARGTVGENDYVETLNILVSLLELPRKDFRGHSALVARQAALIARRLGLPPREVSYTSVAAYLHELGKRPDRHLVLTALAEKPEWKAEARRALRAPIKLFETVHLPVHVNTILAQLHEAFDGSGVPQGAKGEDIAAGARIIACVDAFFDLTRNSANHLSRTLPKEEALQLLHQHAGTLFDPAVVDTLSFLQSGDLLRHRLENDGRQLFIADPDEAVRTDLLDSLGRLGLVVQAVSKLEGVVDAVLAGEADCIAVGLSYGVDDLTALIRYLRGRVESASVPLLVLGEPTDAGSRERLVQAGVTSFVPVPLEPEGAAALIRTAYQDRLENGGPGHTVRGSFDELPSAELAALLGRGKKSGRLVVRRGVSEGYLQLERGKLVVALWADKRGEEALPLLLAAPQADFTWDPEAIATEFPNLDLELEAVASRLP